MNKKKLVIVESPSKAKTIGKYLGAKYQVMASVGHIIDLPKSRMGVDVKNNFKPEYIDVRGTAKTRKEIKKAYDNSNGVYLATDPDREGEAIAYLISKNVLKIDGDIKNRIEFSEITKNAVQTAINTPRKIDMNLVHAQQARRILDRLVGYEISPLFSRKIRRWGLSAGRVQSAGLKIIIDREREIINFKKEEYWDISAVLSKKDNNEKSFEVKLSKKDSKKIKVKSKTEAKTVEAELAGNDYIVSSVDEKERKKNPYPPFITSTLQRESYAKLGFSSARTMRAAQKLYEAGIITYMRTDSIRISAAADAAAKKYIEENYSKAYVGKGVFRNNKKEAQDAHEAIRPTNINKSPANMQKLESDQKKLYDLIWSRFLASRMSPAIFDTVSLRVKNGNYEFTASGQLLKFDGFLRVYRMKTDEKELPKLEKKEILNFIKLNKDQKWTQPPARYTEASFIKILEDLGIGRPSTYASTIATLLKREYIVKEEKSLVPTDLGFLINDLIEKNFLDIADSKFTAKLEEELDEITLGNIKYEDVLNDFYYGKNNKGGFENELLLAEENIDEVKIEDEKIDELCEKCGKPMVIKKGRYGKFKACSDYPNCKNTQPMQEDITNEKCEKCGKPMIVKRGRYGNFLACSNYPECKNTKPILKTIGVPCPICGKDIIEKKTKKGKIFYACSGYPDCKNAYWDKPVNQKCKKCGGLMIEKKGKGKDIKLVCSNKDCKQAESFKN
ncbi:MAG: type I DNA topoisomerase [Clostridiales Family XIII bacterium]|jgi:DNA topoisomerase-1|nr:type I DNA topoisomerase [Clostridiales Family XIII bacterium]